MKRRLLILSSIIAVVLALVGGIVAYAVLNADDTDSNANTAYDKTNERITEFSAITSETLLDEGKNSCYSPISMYISLCTSADFLSEEAADEILNAFDYKDTKEIGEDYKNIIEKVSIRNITEDSAIYLANTIWLESDSVGSIDEGLVSEYQNKFDMEILCEPWVSKDVDTWISEKTGGLIDHITRGDATFALINMTCFKSDWKSPFTCEVSGEFHLATGGSTEVTYLHNIEDMSCVCEEEYTAVRKEYENGASMIFIEPAEEKDLAEIVSADTIKNVLKKFFVEQSSEIKTVNTRVPKFSISSSMEHSDIKESFKGIGISKFFEMESWNNLVVFSKAEPLDIIQKNSISIDKKGTNAVAVTSEDYRILPMTDLKLNLNKPFMYIIEKDGIPLFIGTVYNPTES